MNQFLLRESIQFFIYCTYCTSMFMCMETMDQHEPGTEQEEMDWINNRLFCCLFNQDCQSRLNKPQKSLCVQRGILSAKSTSLWYTSDLFCCVGFWICAKTKAGEIKSTEKKKSFTMKRINPLICFFIRWSTILFIKAQSHDVNNTPQTFMPPNTRQEWIHLLWLKYKTSI